MDMLDFPVTSCDNIHTLAGRVYLPDYRDTTPPRGIVHIVHGMCEHIARYDAFMRDLCSDGWVVCGYDNLGHGHTARDSSELGYISPRNGHDLLAADVGNFGGLIRGLYGSVLENGQSRELPYILMGHSMGSFIVRYAVAKSYAAPDALIVMGTGGPNPAAGVGLAAIGLMKTFRGERYISPFIDNLAFGAYNARFGGKGPEADPYEWISTDKAVRDRYRADPFCTFQFTVSAMGDLVRLSKLTNQRSWSRSLPVGMPVLLVAGEEDPVGNYGKGVLTVRDRLARAGVPVTCHLYPGARHEILNDFSYPDVLRDIRAFLDPIAPPPPAQV